MGLARLAPALPAVPKERLSPRKQHRPALTGKNPSTNTHSRGAAAGWEAGAPPRSHPPAGCILHPTMSASPPSHLPGAAPVNSVFFELSSSNPQTKYCSGFNGLCIMHVYKAAREGPTNGGQRGQIIPGRGRELGFPFGAAGRCVTHGAGGEGRARLRSPPRARAGLGQESPCAAHPVCIHELLHRCLGEPVLPNGSPWPRWQSLQIVSGSLRKAMPNHARGSMAGRRALLAPAGQVAVVQELVRGIAHPSQEPARRAPEWLRPEGRRHPQANTGKLPWTGRARREQSRGQESSLHHREGCKDPEHPPQPGQGPPGSSELELAGGAGAACTVGRLVTAALEFTGV